MKLGETQNKTDNIFDEGWNFYTNELGKKERKFQTIFTICSDDQSAQRIYCTRYSVLFENRWFWCYTGGIVHFQWRVHALCDRIPVRYVWYFVSVVPNRTDQLPMLWYASTHEWNTSCSRWYKVAFVNQDVRRVLRRKMLIQQNRTTPPSRQFAADAMVIAGHLCGGHVPNSWHLNSPEMISTMFRVVFGIARVRNHLILLLWPALLSVTYPNWYWRWCCCCHCCLCCYYCIHCCCHCCHSYNLIDDNIFAFRIVLIRPMDAYHCRSLVWLRMWYDFALRAWSTHLNWTVVDFKGISSTMEYIWIVYVFLQSPSIKVKTKAFSFFLSFLLAVIECNTLKLNTVRMIVVFSLSSHK